MRPGYTAEVPSHTYRALAPCTPYLVLYVYKSIAAPHRMRVYVCSGIDPTSVSVDGGGSCAALPPSHRANRGLKRWCPDTRTQPHTRPPHKPPFSHYHPCSILVPSWSRRCRLAPTRSAESAHWHTGAAPRACSTGRATAAGGSSRACAPSARVCRSTKSLTRRIADTSNV